jgi:glycosyltransferase involved in cell wall biosynthesis
MRVAVVTGICVGRDAISAAAANQAELLAGFDDVDDVCLIAHAFDRETTVRQVVADSSWELINLPDIEDADLVIFHWGIRYDLFNALPILADRRSTVVHFHNLTPIDLVAESDRPVIEESLRQMQLPRMTGSVIWTESLHNIDTLLSWGYSADVVRFMPFPIDPLGPLPDRSVPRRSEGVRLLTVGRLVPAKGVDVLVEAMAAVVCGEGLPVECVLAGSSQMSDQGFLDRLLAEIDRLGVGGQIDVRLDLTDEELWTEYCVADILVVPSLHEGLCVPVIEAYIAGCRVVGTAAGNLPNVIQEPDRVVPAGDSVALAAAIARTVDEIAAEGLHVPSGATDLIETYSRPRVIEMLRVELDAVNALRPSRS